MERSFENTTLLTVFNNFPTRDAQLESRKNNRYEIKARNRNFVVLVRSLALLDER